MEGSLLGAVRATCFLLSAYSAWHGGEAAPRNHRLNLETGSEGGGGGGWRMEDGRWRKRKREAGQKNRIVERWYRSQKGHMEEEMDS